MLKLNGYAFLLIVMLFFSGCASLPTTLPLPLMKTGQPDQVLYLAEEDFAEVKAKAVDDNLEKDLPKDLGAFIPRIRESVKSQKPLMLSRFEMKTLVHVLLNDIPLFLNDKNVISAASNAKRNLANAPKNIKVVLFEYYKTYFKGKFVTRQGVVLAKPTAKINFTDNKITGSIDNDTLIGFITVFLEAVYDFICPTPVFYSVDNKTEYKAIYVKVNKNLKTYNKQELPSDELYTLYYKKVQVSTNNYFNDNKDTPTAAILGHVKSCELGKEELCKDITEKHVKAINLFSLLSGDQSKHLAGLITRSFGGANLGIAFANVDFSIGNNDALSKIVETCFEVSSRRTTEFGLYHFFKKYPEGFYLADKSDKSMDRTNVIDRNDKVGMLLELVD